MAQSTYDDANLILRLYELRREDKMRAALHLVRGEFPLQDDGGNERAMPSRYEANAHRQVVSYWDMAGSFVTSGVLSSDLFFTNTRENLY